MNIAAEIKRAECDALGAAMDQARRSIAIYQATLTEVPELYKELLLSGAYSLDNNEITTEGVNIKFDEKEFICWGTHFPYQIKLLSQGGETNLEYLELVREQQKLVKAKCVLLRALIESLKKATS